MSRLGPSMRPAVLAPAGTSLAYTPVTAGRPRVPVALVATGAMAVDALAALLAVHAAAVLAASNGITAGVARAGVLAAVAALLLIAMGGGYGEAALLRVRRQVSIAAVGGAGAALLTALAFMAFGEMAKLPPPSFVMAAGGLLVAGLAAGRSAFASVMLRAPDGLLTERTVLVGSSRGAAGLVRAAGSRAMPPMRVVGFVDDDAVTLDAGMEHVPYLGDIEQVFALVRRGEVDHVVVALPWTEQRRIFELVERLSDYAVQVSLAPDLPLAGAGRGPLRRGLPTPLLRLCDCPIAGWSAIIKRCEDLLVGGLALALCAIPMALIALIIRFDSPGPVLFRQKRTGFNNRDFEMLKFRTMYHHMADHDVRQQTTRNDPRVTRFGMFLRKTSLDELPQIFNVLRGDMSVVGPRPHAPGTRAGGRLFDEVVERYAARHRVKPGLTGLAQVRGFRGETRTEDKIIKRVESDLEYIDVWSVWLDFVILARTAWIVVQMKNAY